MEDFSYGWMIRLTCVDLLAMLTATFNSMLVFLTAHMHLSLHHPFLHGKHVYLVVFVHYAIRFCFCSSKLCSSYPFWAAECTKQKLCVHTSAQNLLRWVCTYSDMCNLCLLTGVHALHHCWAQSLPVALCWAGAGCHSESQPLATPHLSK